MSNPNVIYSERAMEVLREHAQGKTFAEIGKKRGVTRQRAWQLYLQAINRIRSNPELLDQEPQPMREKIIARTHLGERNQPGIAQRRQS